MSAALSNIMKTAHFGVSDQMGHKLCHLSPKNTHILQTSIYIVDIIKEKDIDLKCLFFFFIRPT